MKIYLILCIICVFVLSASSVFWSEDYNIYISTTQNNNLSQSRVSEAKLLRSYVLRYKENIKNILTINGEINSEYIIKTYRDLDNMSNALLQIQNRFIEEEQSTLLMKQIVNDLKVLNTRIKNYLDEKEIQKLKVLETKKNNYSVLSRHVAGLLDTMILEISSPLLKKSFLSTREKKIVQSLIHIREEKVKIGNFSTLQFYSETSMKEYFKESISTIRKEMRNLKHLL